MYIVRALSRDIDLSACPKSAAETALINCVGDINFQPGFAFIEF